MKAFFAFLALFISFQSFACEEQADGWKADSSANPWQMSQTHSPTEGYWVFINPSRCGTVDGPKQWVFKELQGAKLALEVQNVKKFQAKQEQLVSLGAKPRKFGFDKLCWKDGSLSAYAEDHYHSFQHELQYKVQFMLQNGHLTMEDYKTLPKCPL